MSRIIDIADLLVTSLNVQVFSLEFTSARLYRPVFDLKSMKALHVSVVPAGLELELASRTEAQHDVQIDVGVQKKLSDADNTEIDPLMDLVEEIIDHVRTTRVFGTAVWVGTSNSPIYSPEHLSELRQFTSVISLTFRLVEE